MQESVSPVSEQEIDRVSRATDPFCEPCCESSSSAVQFLRELAAQSTQAVRYSLDPLGTRSATKQSPQAKECLLCALVDMYWSEPGSKAAVPVSIEWRKIKDPGTRGTHSELIMRMRGGSSYDSKRNFAYSLLYRFVRCSNEPAPHPLQKACSVLSSTTQAPAKTSLARPDSAGVFNIDYDWVLKRSRECMNKHRHRTETGAVPASHLIDCRENAIVESPRECRYLALSYVWGVPKQSSRTNQESVRLKSVGHTLGVPLPRVVQDAIQATLSLGYRYLWTDIACIDQTCHSQKMQQIRAMGQIYARADLTLVSLESDCEQPLPGVGSSRRISAHAAVRVGDIAVFDQFSIWSRSVAQIIAQSCWARRGWCFQEGYLSSRIIFFGPKQVMFCCEADCSLEPMPGCRSAYWEESQPLPQDLRDIIGTENFYDAVSRYDIRDLTYRADKLDAFRGYLEHSRTVSYWGMPLTKFCSPDSISRAQRPMTGQLKRSCSPVDRIALMDVLVVWLCWREVAPWPAGQKIASELPTWTWASARRFKLRIEEDVPSTSLARDAEPGDTKFESLATRIRFETYGLDLLSPQELMDENPFHSMLPEGSKYIHVTAPLINIKPAADSGYENIDLEVHGNHEHLWSSFKEPLDTWRFFDDRSDRLIKLARRSEPGSICALVVAYTHHWHYMTHQNVFFLFAIVLQRMGDWYRRIGLMEIALDINRERIDSEPMFSTNKDQTYLWQRGVRALRLMAREASNPTLRIG